MLQFFNETVNLSCRPLTALRPVADLRLGILTIREKWERLLQGTGITEGKADASLVPSPRCGWKREDQRIILTGTPDDFRIISHPWHFFQYNDWAIRADWEWVTAGRESAPVPPSNTVIAPENLFIEPGAAVQCSVLNASTGPIYIGRNATIMEGCLLRGPLAIGEGATLKMGTKIYGATTIGPHCVAGGEIKNSILMGWSNKAHEGYLGDSVIGHWCNLGAGTSNSNVKNTAGQVNMWNELTSEFMAVGLKAGLIMGDYSRSAINTAFNTGTVVGTCCNVFGRGFPPSYVPDFMWGTERYALERALTHIRNWKALKGASLEAEEQILLEKLYQQSN